MNPNQQYFNRLLAIGIFKFIKFNLTNIEMKFVHKNWVDKPKFEEIKARLADVVSELN